MKITSSAILYVLCMVSIPCMGQDNYKILDTLSGNLITNIRQNSDEQIKIVLDKSVYSTGERLWFRVFLTNNVSGKVSVKSKNIFVQLLNNKDSIIKKLILNARQQELAGDIKLKKELATGVYRIRVYTGEMAAINSSIGLEKHIYIINSLDDLIADGDITNRAPTTAKPVIKFFAEGGSIITGSNSLIGYRIMDHQNNPLQVSGVIKNNKDTLSIPFYSDELGLGKFSFFPSKYKKYKAVINVSGKEMIYDLPDFNFSAAQIAVTEDKGVVRKLQVLLEDSIYRPNKLTYLIGINKDSLVFASFGKGMYEVNVTENQIPEGITTFYLFDENNKKLSERSFYKKYESLNVSVNTDKESYFKRSKGLVSVALKDFMNRPLLAALAISIVDSSQYIFTSNKVMVEQFFNSGLLNNNLYTLENLPSRDLDVIMLSLQNTFDINKKTKAFYNFADEEKALNIKGIVVDKQPENKIVTIISTSGTMIISSDTSKMDGNFVIPVSNYSDSTDFTVKVKNMHEKNLDDKVLIKENPFPMVKGKLSGDKIFISDANKKFLHRKFALLDRNEVTNNSSKTKKTLPTDGRRISSNSKIITGESMMKEHVTNLQNVILNLPGVQLINGFITMSGLGGTIPGPSSEPIIIYNGNQLMLGNEGLSPGVNSPVLSFLQGVNPRDVDFVEVLSGPEASTFGLRGGNGVIIINASNQDKSDTTSVPLKTFIADGYYRARPFPYPDYDQKNVQENTELDNRTTLYFNGHLLTDSTGAIKVPFFCSDVTGKFLIVIDGITTKGNAFHKTVSFEVK